MSKATLIIHPEPGRADDPSTWITDDITIDLDVTTPEQTVRIDVRPEEVTMTSRQSNEPRRLFFAATGPASAVLQFVVIDNGGDLDDPVVVGPFATEPEAVQWASQGNDRGVTQLWSVDQYNNKES